MLSGTLAGSQKSNELSINMNNNSTALMPSKLTKVQLAKLKAMESKAGLKPVASKTRYIRQGDTLMKDNTLNKDFKHLYNKPD